MESEAGGRTHSEAAAWPSAGAPGARPKERVGGDRLRDAVEMRVKHNHYVKRAPQLANRLLSPPLRLPRRLRLLLHLSA